MINTINNLDSLDFTESSVSAIKLTEAQIRQASQLASLTEETQRWQSYINNLALFGFKTWLNARNPQDSLSVDKSQNILNAVSCLEIGEFRICLLTQGILEDEVISLPEDVISNRQTNGNLAHFYVLVTVDEEKEEVTIEGLIRYDQLNAYMQSEELTFHGDRLQQQAEPDSTYDLPLNYFDSEINHLLLYLRYLEPSAIQLPVSTPSTVINPQPIQETVMNVASWLNGKLDELSESLSWILFPYQELAISGFRNQPTTSIIEELRNEGIIPDGAKTLLKEIKTTDLDLQLYAITWILSENKWALLLILKRTDDLPLPFDLKLEIKSQDEIFKEETFSYENEEDYLLTQVEGIINQQFTITISLNNQIIKSLVYP